MADRDPAGPPPKEAVDYLRRKGVRTGFDHREVWREEHAHAFTVANMMKLDLLADVQESIAKAKEEGVTAAAWKKGMAAELSKRGWWGRLPPPDPNDPKAVERANLYVSRRLDTIWRVNTRQAAQAGVWERGQRSTSHPYILYRVGPSRRHRKQHLAWDGVLLPKDDPFWAVANPMNGWGCKCYTRFVSKAQYERYVRNGLPQPARGDTPPKGGMKVKTESPQLREMTYYNERTKQTYRGVQGIDPGFEHNPGAGRTEQIEQAFIVKDESRGPAVRPVGRAVADSLRLPENAEDMNPELRQAARRAFAAVSRVHGTGDQTLKTLDVIETAARLGSTRSRDGEPVLVTLGSNSWRPEMMAVHEIGHLIDLDLLPRKGYATRYSPRKPPELDAVMSRIRESAAYDDLRRLLPDQHRMGAVHELFARAYAQWIAWRSGDRRMREIVDTALAFDVTERRLTQWGYEDFLPIADAMDTMFESMGWLTRE